MSQDTVSDIDRIDALLSEAQQLKYHDFHRIVALGKEAYTLSIAIDYWSGITRSLYFVALGYLRLGDFPEASVPAKESLWVAREHGFAIEEGYALSAMGAIFGQMGNHTDALELQLEQLKIAEEAQHPELTAYALHDIGYTYRVLKDYSASVAILEKCIRFAEAGRVPHIRSTALLTLADVYGDQGEHHKALRLANESLKEARLEGETDIQIYALNRIAASNSGLEHYEKARVALEEGLALAKSIDSLDIAMLLNSLGHLHMRQKAYKAAVAVLDEAVETALRQQNLPVLADIHFNLAQTYKQAGDFAKALDYYEQYQVAKDAIHNENSDSRFQVIRTLYELDTAQKEVELHKFRSEAVERELEESKQAEAERIKAERLQATLEKERELSQVKEKIFSRISHEFRTPLSIIRVSTDILTRYTSQLSSEQQNTHQMRINEQFDIIENKLSDIATILRTSNQDRTVHRQFMLLKPLCLRAGVMALQLVGTTDRVMLQLDSNADEIYTDAEAVLEIMVNLLTNALKFSTEFVEFNVEHQISQLIIQVRDSGIGILPDEQEKVFQPLIRGSNIDETPGNGLGLTIVQNNVSLLGGELQLHSVPNKGTTITIYIPLFPSQSVDSGNLAADT